MAGRANSFNILRSPPGSATLPVTTSRATAVARHPPPVKEWLGPVVSVDLVAQLARAYLTHWPIEKGKWRIWSRLYPRLRRAQFPAGFYQLKHGVAMHLDPEQYIDQHCFYWGLWEPDETRVLRQLLRQGETFVDVGANVGYFTLLAASLVGRAGRVFAFEPVPPTVRRLERNVAASGSPNVTIVPAAAAAVGGQVRIGRHGVGDVSGQNTMRPGDAGDCWLVNAVRIDESVPATLPVRLMKLDADGAELLALQGASGLLRRADAPYLLCEVTDAFLRDLGGSAAALWALLQQYGYRHAYDCRRGRLTAISPRALTDEEQVNVLFSKAPVA